MQIGSRLDADWKQIGSRLEADWKQIGWQKIEKNRRKYEKKRGKSNQSNYK